jgi:hypothetical protein
MMNQEIFVWFDKWFNENKEFLTQKELELDFSEKRGEEEIWARWVDISSANKLGNVIVYKVGTCDTFSSSFAGNDDSQASADFINSEEELNKLLNDYFGRF